MVLCCLIPVPFIKNMEILCSSTDTWDAFIDRHPKNTQDILHSPAQSVAIPWAECAEHNLGEKGPAVPDRQSSALPQACPEVLPSQEIIFKITLTLFNVR